MRQDQATTVQAPACQKALIFQREVAEGIMVSTSGSSNAAYLYGLASSDHQIGTWPATHDLNYAVCLRLKCLQVLVSGTRKLERYLSDWAAWSTIQGKKASLAANDHPVLAQYFSILFRVTSTPRFLGSIVSTDSISTVQGV